MSRVSPCLPFFLRHLGRWRMGECLHSLPTENRFCIRLQFCYLAPLGFTQNWLVDWGKRLHSLPAENRSYIHRQFCLQVCNANSVAIPYELRILRKTDLAGIANLRCLCVRDWNGREAKLAARRGRRRKPKP